MVPLYSINDLFVCIDSPGTKVEEISFKEPAAAEKIRKLDEDAATILTSTRRCEGSGELEDGVLYKSRENGDVRAGEGGGGGWWRRKREINELGVETFE